MFGKLKSKPKEANGSEKGSLSKKSHAKHPESSPQVVRKCDANQSVPLARRQNPPESPTFNNRFKMSRESSYASISQTPNRVKSYISGNDSFDRSLVGDFSKNSLIIERLKTEIQDLRVQYQNDLGSLRRESFDIQQDIKKTKREMQDCINELNDVMKSTVDQLDVEVRLLSKSIYNIQKHYVKFVPFILKNFLLMTKNQEYLEDRTKQLESQKLTTNDIYWPRSCCDKVNECQCTYSISISPVTKDDTFFKLVFSPVEEICSSKFTKEAKEQVYTMPVIESQSPSTSICPSFPEPVANNSVHRKLLLGTKAIPYYLKRLQNIDNTSPAYTSPINDSFTFDGKYKSKKLFTNTIAMETSEPLSFKDLKKRHLKRKFSGLRCQSYPCINPPVITNVEFKIKDEEPLFTSESDCEMCAADSNLLMCQSDTDVCRRRIHALSNSHEEDGGQCQEAPTETVIYQKLSNSFVQHLLQFKTTEDDSRTSNNDDIKENHFSIILSRSKVSLLLSNNFTDINSGILSNSNFLNTRRCSSHNQLKQKATQQNKIDDSDYFTLHLNKHAAPLINLASVETLSDNASFIDDDYGQQMLIDQRNTGEYMSESYEQLCCDLHQFSLPRSSVNNIFRQFRA